MEPRPEPPPWLPVTRTPSPPAPSAGAAGGAGARPADGGAAPSGGGASPPPATPRPTFTWQRLTRTRRGAAGLAIGSAALLLWPFAGWAAIPWLVGLGVLVLLRLLRLDGLLRGWVWHLGGLVVVAGLMYSTGPWAWALAASIGVLVAGLLQLPWWRLAAVGVVMCAVSGVGFAFSPDINEIAKDYSHDKGKTVAVSLAASSVLARQIEASAGADIFISADLDWMDYLDNKGLIDHASRANLLGNRLVLVATKDSNLRLTIAPHFDLGAALKGAVNEVIDLIPLFKTFEVMKAGGSGGDW